MGKHKEEMQYLREYDPITYYEMTDDPTGVDSEIPGCAGFLISLIVVALIAAAIFLIK